MTYRVSQHVPNRDVADIAKYEKNRENLFTFQQSSADIPST